MCENSIYESRDHRPAAGARAARQALAARVQPAHRLRTNVVYMWEAGRTFPTASVALRAAQRAGIDVRAALARFYRVTPEWLAGTADPTTPAAVCSLLDDLRAGRSVVQLARAVERSRFAVARWLHGDAQPRLPDFLRLIEGATLRLLDFVAAFVDPERLPVLQKAWRALETSRRAAYEVPWTHAVLRAIELDAYRKLHAHEAGWIAQRLGISNAEEERCLRLLAQTGQIRLQHRRYVATEVQAVDTRREPEAAARLRRFWAEAGLARAEGDPDAVLSFNLATIAERDLERVRELHRRYFSELRDIVAHSDSGRAHPARQRPARAARLSTTSGAPPAQRCHRRARRRKAPVRCAGQLRDRDRLVRLRRRAWRPPRFFSSTLTSLEMPGVSMVTPYSTSDDCIVVLSARSA